MCMSTKCIYLKHVSSLSSEAFIATLLCFISHRGKRDQIYSNCGTNIRGMAKEITKLFKEAAEEEQIHWHFNPLSVANFRGIWEAGVKSTKSHISRVNGDQVLTYEEFYTLLVQIEAILNSMPLCALSRDPNNFTCLTPGNFLILAPLNSLPEPDYAQVRLNHLSRWQLLQRMQQDFWSCWHREYLHTLVQQNKWLDNPNNIQPDTLVLINNVQSPPHRWHLARIEQVHLGKGGNVRIVTI